MSSPAPNRQNADPFFVFEATRIFRTFEDTKQKEYYATVRANLILQAQFSQAEETARHCYLRSRRFRNSPLSNPNSSTHNPPLSSRTHTDPSLESLQRISSFDQIYPRSNSHTVSFPYLPKMPMYDSWIPVSHDFWFKGDKPERYVPYLGESGKQRKMAKQVYRQMVTYYPALIYDNSDGEPTTNFARFKTPKNDSFYDLKFRRRREAERHTVLAITRRYGRESAVLRALAVVFGKKDVQLVKLVYKIAKGRERQQLEELKARNVASKFTTAMRHVVTRDSHDESPPANFMDGTYGRDGYSSDESSDDDSDDDGYIDKSCSMSVKRCLKHFCFVCYDFGCEQHKGQNVQPTEIIRDEWIERRLRRITRERLEPCGVHCYLIQDGAVSLENRKRRMRWTCADDDILQEAQTLMGKDWCSVASVVGSRTCREVRERSEKLGLFGSSKELSKRMRAVNVDGLDSGSDEDKAPTAGGAIGSNVGTGEGHNTKPRFVPCNHKGSCTKKNRCTCLERGVKCESLCGCRTGRFGETGCGIGWIGPRTPQGMKKLCPNRRPTCYCRRSGCHSETCECIAGEVTCDPDFCEGCQAEFLPKSRAIGERQCRNVDLVVGRHKRVHFGISGVHGYGLFAGQSFHKGELIGPYCGRLMYTQLTDKLLLVSQAKKSTYAFDVTHDLAVDAGLLGSKVKFVNHSEDSHRRNCTSMLLRVRGQWRISVRATRAIQKGEELLMDYHLNQGNFFNPSDEEGDDDDGEDSSDDDEDDDDEC